jgi:hypothetical protein
MVLPTDLSRHILTFTESSHLCKLMADVLVHMHEFCEEHESGELTYRIQLQSEIGHDFHSDWVCSFELGVDYWYIKELHGENPFKLEFCIVWQNLKHGDLSRVDFEYEGSDLFDPRDLHERLQRTAPFEIGELPPIVGSVWEISFKKRGLIQPVESHFVKARHMYRAGALTQHLGL